MNALSCVHSRIQLAGLEMVERSNCKVVCLLKGQEWIGPKPGKGLTIVPARIEKPLRTWSEGFQGIRRIKRSQSPRVTVEYFPVFDLWE